VKEKNKIEGEEDENKTEKWKKHKIRKEPYQTLRDHGLMALDTIMVELQRCMKNSMGSGNGWRNGGKLEGTCKQWKVKEVIGFP